MKNKIDLRSLPPLKSLKGFEAAARLQSIRGAAEELSLTHPAITHQIQVLEKHLHTKLFSRDGRNIILTPEGQLFYPFVRDALEELISGIETLRRTTMSHTSQPLRIQAYVTTSIRWLAPRLSEFRARYPGIDLHLTTCSVEWEFDESNADIGLIHSRHPLPDHLHWIKLFDSQLFPVCSPQLIQERQGTIQPADLIDYPLFQVYTESWSWDDWFNKTISFNQATRKSQIIVDTLAIALEMASRGEGIALVNGPAAYDDLKSGRLVKPVEQSVGGFGEWGVVCHEEILDDNRAATFIKWLTEEAAKL